MSLLNDDKSPAPRVQRFLSEEALERLEVRLQELAQLSDEYAAALRTGHADPDLAERFTAAARQATGSAELLELLREADRERHENQTITQISMAFASAAGIDELLRLVLDLVKRVVQYDAGGIFLYNRDISQIEIDLLRGYEKIDRDLIYKKFQKGVAVGEGIVGTVIKTGRPINVRDVRTDPRYINGRNGTLSEVAVPIIVQDEVIGALNLESDHTDNFTERDVRSLIVFANHAGVALERAKAERLRMHSKRIEEEISLARRIQLTFLPDSNPQFAPYDIAGVNISSSEVGGDYYDYIQLTDTDLGICIADVTGHGMGAALLMATYRACLRIESRNNFAIRTILSKVNNFIYETNPPDAFVTGVYGVLDRKNDIFSYSNAGHNWPILLRGDGTIERLDTGGLLVGAFPKVKYEETRVKINAGDLLLLFTDGANEALCRDGDQFGEGRLLESLERHRHLPAGEMVKAIADDVIEFRSEDEVQDDLTLMVIKHD